MAKMSILKKRAWLALIIAFILLMLIFLFICRTTLLNNKISTADKSRKEAGNVSEGQLIKVTLTAGPFDLHRRYKSMEGPYIKYDFKVGDLISSKEIVLPEKMVSYVEHESTPTATSISVGDKISSAPRSLLWLKGAELEVLDEHDKVLPTSEFICHWNLDVVPTFRSLIFSQSSIGSSRLMTISQGQSEIYFPPGYAVPVASDEVWDTMFQVANRTTDKHRRLKHRCTMYFIKDANLTRPITALTWYTPFVYVITNTNSADAAQKDKADCPSCLGQMCGVNAPNNKMLPLFQDHLGHFATGHWVVPPGKHTYVSPIQEWLCPGFSGSSHTIHAVWSHIHPFCTSLALYKCEGNSRRQIFSNAVKTKTAPGIEIESIRYLCSQKGIWIDQGQYELEVTYNNTSGVPQDSMAVAGIFCADNTFAKPDWDLGKVPAETLSEGR